MKKRVNVLFFGSCFIIAVLLEIYCLLIFNGDIFSAAALGIVVLITGYLFMDSIRTEMKQKSENVKFYLEKILGEDTEKWRERYSELMNLQKASYVAVKKSSALHTEQFEELQRRLDTLERSNILALERITELQKKSLEGQKKALNLEIHYNKENTKQIISFLKKEADRNEMQKLAESPTQEKNDTPETDWMDKGEPQTEVLNSIDEVTEIERPDIVPLYSDPNKNLTADEIASLFTSYGK